MYPNEFIIISNLAAETLSESLNESINELTIEIITEPQNTSDKMDGEHVLKITNLISDTVYQIGEVSLEHDNQSVDLDDQPVQISVNSEEIDVKVNFKLSTKTTLITIGSILGGLAIIEYFLQIFS